MFALFFQGRRLLMTILILIGAIVLSGLGVWQWNRHLQRSQLNQRIISRMAEPPIELASSQIDPQQLDYRRVVLRGSFDEGQSILLRNRTYQGATGYHLITPLRLTGSDRVVLIDRGWIPFNQSDAQARRLYAAPGEQTIEGVARQSQHGLAGPQDPPFTSAQPRLDAWFRVDIERIQQQIGAPLLPIFVELQPGPEPAERPPFPTATSDLGLGSHLGYSIQWFSFAIILIVGYIALMLRTQKQEPRSQENRGVRITREQGNERTKEQEKPGVRSQKS